MLKGQMQLQSVSVSVFAPCSVASSEVKLGSKADFLLVDFHGRLKHPSFFARQSSAFVAPLLLDEV